MFKTKVLVNTIIQIPVYIISFFLITIPSLIYGISAWLLIPLAWLLRLIIQRTVLSYSAGIYSLKMSTIVVLFIIPAIFYFWVWEPLGWIIFTWMGLYLLLRIYTGVHQKGKRSIEAWIQLESLEKKGKNTYIKYNPIVTIVTLVLTVTALLAGYYIGGENGLLIGALFSIVIWCLSPYARETIVEK